MSVFPKKLFLNRNFIRYLGILSVSEVADFQVFAHTSVAVINAQEKDILDIAVKSYPEFGDLDNAFNNYFKNDPIASDNYINHSFYNLSNLLQNWLIQQEVLADELLQKQLLLRVNKKRFQHSQFFKNAEKTLDFLHTNQLEIPDNWLHRHQVNAQIFYHTGLEKFVPNPVHLRNMENNLDLHYYGLKIRLLAQKLLRSQIIKEDDVPDDATTLLAFAEAHQHLTFFFLYGKLIRYFLNPDDDYFQEIVAIFQEKRLELDRIEQAIVANFLTNILTPKVNSGSVFHQNMQFDLYKFALEKNLVTLDNEMSPTFLHNFFILACLLKKFKFAQQILKKYSPLLPTNIASDLTNLLSCTLSFHQKKYAETESNLTIVHFQHPEFKINGRVLLLKCFYERFQMDYGFKSTFLAEVISFKKFINRQTFLVPNKKKPILNLVIVFRQFVKFKSLPFSKRAAEKQRIAAFLHNPENSIRSKHWLLEKFKELG